MPSQWLLKYQQANFRQVPFFVESHEFSGGRRAVTHEFPQRNRSRTEDLGRRIRKFSIDAYVMETSDFDYFIFRDNLIDALEQEGPGDLVHPYLGNVRVQVDSFTQSESEGEGRIAKFSIQFIEAGQLVFPKISESNNDKIVAAADQVLADEKNIFEQALDVIGQASFVADAAAADMQAQVAFMDAQVAKVTGPITELTFALDNLSDQATALVQTPGRLADSVQNSFELLASTVTPSSASAVLGGFVNAGAAVTPILGTTPSNVQAQKNQNATVNLYKVSAYANDAKALGDILFTSVTDALESRSRLLGNLDEQLEDPDTDDDLFQSIMDLKSALVQSIPSQDVGELRNVALPKTIPSIVVAHEYFLDLDREQEIIDENNVSNPAFVSGGTEIKVVSSGRN